MNWAAFLFPSGKSYNCPLGTGQFKQFMTSQKYLQYKTIYLDELKNKSKC